MQHFGHDEAVHNPTLNTGATSVVLDLPFDGNYNGSIGADDLLLAVQAFGFGC